MKKKIALLMTAVILAASVAGCGNTQTAAPAENAEANTEVAEGTEYKIGVLQLVEHTALDSANKGFVDALGEAGLNCVIDQQNAQNDQSACQTIAEKFVNDQKDLVLAIATPAAQAMAGATAEIPVLVTAVTDPADAGLVASNEEPGGNISGTSDLTPVKEQIDLLKELVPGAKKVGILYCSAESNSEFQANMAIEACTAAGFESETFTVASSNEIQSVVESMVSQVDVIYTPTDNTIAAGMATVGMVATENGIPVICGEEGMVTAGGLATYGIDYYQLGYMAGKQAVDILINNADVSKMPIGYLKAEECALTVNEEVAASLNIDISAVK